MGLVVYLRNSNPSSAFPQRYILSPADNRVGVRLLLLVAYLSIDLISFFFFWFSFSYSISLSLSRSAELESNRWQRIAWNGKTKEINWGRSGLAWEMIHYLFTLSPTLLYKHIKPYALWWIDMFIDRINGHSVSHLIFDCMRVFFLFLSSPVKRETQ